MEPCALDTSYRDDGWYLMERLFPIHRTLVNRGYLQSLQIINETLPLTIKEYPSGDEVWDWIIPNAWDVKEAWIKDENGNKVIDFANNNLHLAAYSIPFSGVLSREELLPHISYLEELPDAIPFEYLYYGKNDWRFCMSKNQLEMLKGSHFEVKIEVDYYPSYLRIGECLLPGETDTEILVTAYLCHPSMANDSLSGVVVGTEVFRFLSRLKHRHYTYRFIIIPETIGAITFLAKHEEILPRIRGGFVVTCCGDPGPLRYKKSYFGDAFVDRAAVHALAHEMNGADFVVEDFSPAGSDERQFNAPGVRIPFGSLMRSRYEIYPEYHTSLDNLSLVRPEYLFETMHALVKMLYVIDNNTIFKNKFRGEPFLSKHGLHIPFKNDKGAGFLNQIIIHETDGTKDVLQIAEKHACSFYSLLEISLAFEKAGLIERKPS
ncbi:MAG: DUF4910 domain-containing protein [Candidatus Hydrogenedentota bacterium]|nr:MAG: DUF4910 domain-containing protein [Candidatus Hydrogenedentota bacterium]